MTTLQDKLDIESKDVRLLIVDDEQETLIMLSEFLGGQGYNVDTCSDGEQALELIDQHYYNVVITDLMMTPIHGSDIMQKAKEKKASTEVVVITGFATLDSTIEAIRHHVFDFLEKPFNLKKLGITLQNAIEKNLLTLYNELLFDQLHKQNELLEMRIREATRELEELTVRDGLTNLYNYRYFVNILTAEISRSIRYNRPLSVVMIDIDYFKQFNDQHGHQAGNDALIQIARMLERETRYPDTIVRYGGEEFSILLPETEKDDAIRIVNRVLEACRQLELKLESPTNLGVLSLSGGVACCPADGDEIDLLVKRADRALYVSKNNGRNLLTPYSAELKND